jgi:hypothetical protein
MLPVVFAVLPWFGIFQTPVVILGANLAGARAVHFGPNLGTIVESEPSLGFSLVVLPPPGSGIVDVTVTTPSGTSAVTPAGRYSYLLPGTGPAAPTVTAVTPNYGPEQGGQPVTITGTDFVPGQTQVVFG